MTDADTNAAVTALRGWFQSQEIKPPDAGPIMIRLVAELLVEKTKKLEDLNEAIILHNQLLTFEVAQQLR